MERLKKTRGKSLFVTIVASVLLLAVGATFAWMSFSKKVETPLSALKVELEVSFDMYDSDNGNNSIGYDDVVAKKISFYGTSTSDCYVRAKFQYASTDTSAEGKKFLLAMNCPDVTTYTGTDYKWVRYKDGYYYLVNSTSGEPYVYTKTTASSSAPTIFCESVKYLGVSLSYGVATKDDGLKLITEVQAVQAKNVFNNETDKFARLSSVFTETFGEDEFAGVIVMFDAKGGTNVDAQVFDNTTSTIDTSKATPTKTNYTFGGWYTDSDCTDSKKFDTTKAVDTSIVLYAKWTKNN